MNLLDNRSYNPVVSKFLIDSIMHEVDHINHRCYQLNHTGHKVTYNIIVLDNVPFEVDLLLDEWDIKQL